MLSKVSPALTTYSLSVKLSTVGRPPTGGSGRRGVVATTVGVRSTGAASFFSGSVTGAATTTGGASGGVLDGFSGFSCLLSMAGTADGATAGAFVVGADGGGTPREPGDGGVIISCLLFGSPD